MELFCLCKAIPLPVMDSTRQLKFSRLILKELAELFSREGRNFYGTAFVTVTNVRVTPDLAMARVQLSMFKEKNPQHLLDTIKKHSGEIRKKLGMKIKNQVRVVPDLEFFIDDSLDYVEKMEHLFKGLVIPPADENETND